MRSPADQQTRLTLRERNRRKHRLSNAQPATPLSLHLAGTHNERRDTTQQKGAAMLL